MEGGRGNRSGTSLPSHPPHWGLWLFAATKRFGLKEENWDRLGAPGWAQGAEGDVRPPSLFGGRWEPVGVLASAIHPPPGPEWWKAVTKGGI